MDHLLLWAVWGRRGAFAGRGTGSHGPPPASSLIFGLITCLTGVLGVGLGVEISRRLRRSNPRADPLVCAAGLLGSAPFLFLSLACARGSIVATYVSSRRCQKGCSGSGVVGRCAGAGLGSVSMVAQRPRGPECLVLNLDSGSSQLCDIGQVS